MSRIPIGSSSSQEARPRHPDPEDLLRPVRDDVAVRGRRAHRRQVGHHPRRHRRVRPAPASSGPRGPGPRTASPASIVAVDAPDLDEDGKPTGTTHRVARDEGLRETTLEKLAQLKPVAREDGVHTAGSRRRSPTAPAAVLLMTEEKAAALGLTPKARIVDTCLVGVDPVLMLTGPIDATQRLLERTGLTHRRHRHRSRSTRRSPRSCWPGQKELGADLGAGQPERRRHRPRPPARRHRRGPDDQGAARARAHRRPLRPGHDVLRRRPRHRHHHRAALTCAAPAPSWRSPWRSSPSSARARRPGGP